MIEKLGCVVVDIIVEVLEYVICNFLWLKFMCWGVGLLCWVCLLYLILCILEDEGGVEVVLLDVDGIILGNMIKGYWFMVFVVFVVLFFDDYEVKLKWVNVVLCVEECVEIIWYDVIN